MFTSKLTSTRLLAILLAIASVVFGTACNKDVNLRDFANYKQYVIAPLRADNSADKQWAEYLYNHMSKRTAEDGLVNYRRPSRSVNPQLFVRVSLDPDAEHEYEIKVSDDEVLIIGRHKATMLWLVYQFMVNIGTDDPRIHTTDLQPPMLTIENIAGDFAFDFRGIHSIANKDVDQMLMIASQSIDSDWGLWGHNIGSLFGPDVPTSVMAEVNGHRNPDQFCFSSPKLFETIERYIVDNYGDTPDDFVRFLIMPNDNDLVCTCETCTGLGNDEHNASPAVSDLIHRLCERFPYHQFFMGGYSTTATPPFDPLPGNAGAFLSAINLPMRAHPEENEEFARLFNQWKYVANTIYIWDYIRNFDDYLTVYPMLNLMAERIKYYKNLGVEGIFLNGALPDYATHNYMQTFVCAGLMINPDASVNDLIHRFLAHHYPKTYPIIEPMYLQYELRAMTSGKTLPFYGGIDDAVDIYVNPQEFFDYYHRLTRAARGLEGSERVYCSRTIISLSFMALELIRRTTDIYDPENYREYINTLSDHVTFPEINNYREADGSIDSYLKEWQAVAKQLPIFRDNVFRDQLLTTNTPLDEGEEQLSQLTDGIPGFTTDYHTGWFINSQKELELNLPPRPRAAHQIIVSTLNAPKWRLAPPTRVELYQDGQLVSFGTPEPIAERGRSLIRLNLPGSDMHKPLKLKIIASNEGKIAIDEVIAITKQ